MSAGVSANSTVAPRAVALRSKISSQTSRLSSARLRIALPASRVPSKSSSSTSDARRLATNLPLHLLEVALQPRVVQLDVRALLEVHRCDLHGVPESVAPRGQAGRSPASTSATCSTCVFVSPRRRSRPSMFSMQPRSPSTTASAPRCRDVPALVVGEARRDLAELDRERAAEAAAGLALGHLRELRRRAPWRAARAAAP